MSQKAKLQLKTHKLERDVPTYLLDMKKSVALFQPIVRQL